MCVSKLSIKVDYSNQLSCERLDIRPPGNSADLTSSTILHSTITKAFLRCNAALTELHFYDFPVADWCSIIRVFTFALSWLYRTGLRIPIEMNKQKDFNKPQFQFEKFKEGQW